MVGPYVVKALEKHHRLRLGDISDIVSDDLGEHTTGRSVKDSPHEYFHVDVSDPDQVMAAVDGMDAIVNLTVVRGDRKLAFDVNARGCYNMMAAAVRHGVRRVINTAVDKAVYGPSYKRYDYLLGPAVPPHPGTESIYGLTKALGLETCRVFAESHDVYVMVFVLASLKYANDHAANLRRDVGTYSPDELDVEPFAVTWEDTAEAVKAGLSVDLDRLPSRFEILNIFTDQPHQKFTNEKTHRILQWQPTEEYTGYWLKSRRWGRR